MKIGFRTNSYVKKEVAILGATLTAGSPVNPHEGKGTRKWHHARKLGQMPRYRPATPSTRMMLFSASIAPLYLIVPFCMPVTCILRRSTSKGYVSVWEIEPGEKHT